jgi:hypothetical protein
MSFRKIILSGLFLSSSICAAAQYNTINEWYVGIQGGATASTIILVPKLVDKFYSMGQTGGLILRHLSEQHFGLQVECNYLLAGWKEDYYGNKIWKDYTYSRQFGFVEVPVLAHLYAKSGAARFFLQFGPSFSYYVEGTDVVENRSPEVLLQHEKSIESPFQYGLTGGLGLEFKMGRSQVGLEGRYTYNLTNIFKDQVGEDFANSNLQVISLRMHVLLNLSK